MAEKRQGLFRRNKNKGSSAASAKQPKGAPESQPVQDGKKQTQEQDGGQSHRTRKVPAMVRIMHERLGSSETADVRLFMNILRMADEHPAGVVLTLLRCAPTCDRAAATMWRTIASSSPTVEKVLPTLLSVMEDWPLHSMFTSDGDDTDVFALAATLVVWVIIRVPKCRDAMHSNAPHLLVALLVQIFDSTVHGSEEVDAFWRQCQEEHHLDTNPSRYSIPVLPSIPYPQVCSAYRFAVQTMKALLCRLRCDNVVMEMGRKHGWDTLLCADTQHYAVGLLARKMRHDVTPLCSRVACHLLGLLSTVGHRWDLPFLAFLVEVLECLDLRECSDSVLEMMSRYLQSECRERRRLALRGLLVLIKEPSMARRMGILSQRLVDVLSDADAEVVRLSLSVFMNVLQYKDILVSSTTAPKLAEALLLLFDHDNSHVQLLSIQLFGEVMDLVVDQGKKPLKRIVGQSLLPLYLHCHEENQRVANASMDTLLHATRFLKKRGLKQAVKNENLMKFGKCLLADDRSRAAEHLRRALPYLESPQESLREAALRFIGEPRARAPSPPCPGAAARAAAALTGSVFPGMAGRYLRGQPGELHVLSQALEAMSKDDSPSSTNLEIQAIFGQRCAELRSSTGFGEPVSQEQYPEPVKRTTPLGVTPGTADAGHS
ncbi:maestro heat-like repeat-containing protein family member 7 [Sylvia atricapilla]|uniref:maestro heat-like repeat-containing protein family member 7 n=1 Tax=Sylvia atricapilla TaxID=48155 RepID=UPI0033995B31